MRTLTSYRRLSAVLVLWLLAASQSQIRAGDAPEPPRLTPVRVESTINVKDAGAAGNGTTDDTAAFQKALDGTKREVIIPPGEYRISSSLKVHSQTLVKASCASIIRLADHAGNNSGSFLLCNADPKEGNSDIVIEGGIWDGNSEHNPRGKEYQPGAYGGVVLTFSRVRNLALRGLTIRNPESFSIRLGRVADFAVEDIVFDQARARPNQDGVHVGGFCERGIIRRLSVSSPSGTNDDMVALNADDDLRRHFNRGMECGPIRDIRIEGLEAANAYTFVRLLSRENPIENVAIDGIRGGCRTNVLNLDRWRFPPGGGKIRDVSVRNLRVHKCENNAHPYILIETAVERLRIEDVQRQTADDASATTLVIDNGKTNRIEIRGLTRRQGEDLLMRSPQKSRGAVVVRPASSGRDLRDATATTANKIILSEGGFAALDLSWREP